MKTHLTTPLAAEDLAQLTAGDLVLLSGTIYTARNAAHRRMQELLEAGKEPPFPLEGAVIYYVAPSPAPYGFVIGSAGPSSAYHMDAFAPLLHELGLAATIGKGKRAPNVREALARSGTVYFSATGGAGAMLSRHITEARVIAYPGLGSEAIRELTVEEFPLLVVYDAKGASIYPEDEVITLTDQEESSMD